MSPVERGGEAETTRNESEWREKINRQTEETAYVQQCIATSRTIVYVHAARLSDDAAEAVRNALSGAGYSVPDLEGVRGVPDQQVRYFHSTDRAAAESVAERASEALPATGVSDAWSTLWI